MKILRFFDKLEDRVRFFLSRQPILYALIAGVTIVLFWRGVEMTADLFPFMNGPVSLIVSIVIALMTGVFVSFFIGEQIIISGIKHEKTIEEKTAEEIQEEDVDLHHIKAEIVKLQKIVAELSLKLEKKE